MIPAGCSNAVYDARMADALASPVLAGIEGVAFGDLFLEDVRADRRARLAESGRRGLFPALGS